MNTSSPKPPASPFTELDGHKSVTPWVMAAMVVITLLGALLRFYHLSLQSLWLDELASWWLSHDQSVWRYLLGRAPRETNPPGYQILLIFVERYLGDSETVLRLPSAMAGTVAIPVMFALGRRMYSARVGLTAALLLAVSWAPINYSQEARTYVFTLLATLLTFLLWYPLFVAGKARVTAPKRWAIAYCIAAVVLLYLHYYGALIVIGQALATLWLVRTSRTAVRRALVMYAVVLLAYTPWLLVSIVQYVVNFGRSWRQKPDAGFFLSYLRFAFNRNQTLAILAALAILAFVVLLLWRRRRQGDQAAFLREDTVLLWWLLFPVVVAYLVSVIGSPLLVDYYLIVVLPAVYLIVARVVAQLPAPPWTKMVITLVLATAILADLTLNMGYYTYASKTQFREAVRYVVQHHTVGTPPIVIASPWNPAFFDYYFERQGSRLRTDILAGRATDIAKVQEALRSSRAERIWYIRAHDAADPAFVAFLQRDLRLVDRHDFLGADVWLFERR